jgi:hypothetical protein
MSDIDTLLRRSMAAPVPRLSPDFHPSLSRKLQRQKPFGRILLASYAAVSIIVSIVLMRSQGLGWTPAAALTLGPLAALALAIQLRRRLTAV